MIRQEYVDGAVNFLVHPTTTSATLDQKISFLQSKNMTNEEIDVALKRAADGSAVASMSPQATAGQSNYGYPTQYAMGRHTYQTYQGSPWGPPPEILHRDWRDWFIAGTVSTGVGYGLYAIAKRYILPLISPPTPSQLESDKASIDESFSRAFTLIDQLAADTASLKASEVERTDKLDSALQDVETVVSDLKQANIRREAESKALDDQIREMKDTLPKVLDNWESARDNRLNDLGAELRSLKKLLGIRMNAGAGTQPSIARGHSGIPAKDKPSASGAVSPNLSAKATGDSQNDIPGSPIPNPSSTLPQREILSSYRGSSSKASIPAWQMASLNDKPTSDISLKPDMTLMERDTPSGFQGSSSRKPSISSWQMPASIEKSAGDASSKEDSGPTERAVSSGNKNVSKASIPSWQMAGVDEKSSGEDENETGASADRFLKTSSFS